MKKRNIIIITALLIFVVILYILYGSHDKISLDTVSAITLRTTTGEIKLNKADFEKYVDLYNAANWRQISNDEMIAKANGLTVDIVNNKGELKQFFVVLKPDDIFLVADDKIGRFATNPNRDLLFSDQLLTGLAEPFRAPQLHLTGVDNDRLIDANQSLWQFQEIDGAAAKRQQSYQCDSCSNLLVISDPQTMLQFELDSDLAVESLAVTANQKPLAVNANNQFSVLPKSGVVDYQIMIKTKATQLGLYQATAEFSYQISLKQNFAAQASILQNEQTVGGFFLIRGQYFDDKTQLLVEQSIIDRPIQPYRLDDAVLAVIPLDYYAQTGEHEVVLYAVKDDVKTELARQKITVLDRQYEMQDLTISSTTEETARTTEAYQEYRSDFKPVRQISAGYQMWDGPFIMPIDGRLTTDYGAKRKVNDELTRYRHDGIDLAAPSGTEIMASNRGKVVFSQSLILTGNSIIIDHGLGFFTYYLHMDERRVTVGEMVEKGQIIGTVGTTGFSTGPHLHFTASYHLNNINPYTLLEWSGEWRQELKENEGE